MSEEKQVCLECGEEKELSDYPQDKRAKTGYKKVCKSCFNNKYKDRNKKAIEPEKVIEDYFKEKVPEIYKAISIQAIAEERPFMEVLIGCIQPKAEFMKIVDEYGSKVD